MKKLLSILFGLIPLFATSQLNTTDTAYKVDRARQWWTTNFQKRLYTDFRLERIGWNFSHYNTAGLPAAPDQGAMFYNTDSINKVAIYNGSGYVYLGVSTINDGGITSLNGLTGLTQTFATGTTGTDFNISSSGTTHTFNIPDISAANTRGFMSNGTQTIPGTKTWTGASAIFGATGVNANISLRRTSDGAEVGVIGVSTNPFFNTQSGTFDFQSASVSRMRIGTVGVYIGSATTPTANMNVGAALTRANNGTAGIMTGFLATTYTDNTTAGSGTVTHTAAIGIARATFAATNSSITYTNASTLYIDNAPANGTNVTITNPWSIYVAAGRANFVGGIQFSQGSDATGDTYYRNGSGLHTRLAIGTAAQLYVVNAGATAPEWFTGAIANTATLDFPNTAAGTSSDLTITVTGAADGDAVSIGVPNGSTVANGCFTAWVSATNTVTIRFTNNALLAAFDPASGTFKATVLKF